MSLCQNQTQQAFQLSGGFKSAQFAKAAASPYNQKVGHFITKEKRAKLSKDIKEAHFYLGFDSKQYTILYIKISRIY